MEGARIAVSEGQEGHGLGMGKRMWPPSERFRGEHFDVDRVWALLVISGVMGDSVRKGEEST